jgi:hypothetical protein
MHRLAPPLTRPEEVAAGDSRTFDVDRSFLACEG